MSQFPLGVPLIFEEELLLWTVENIYTKKECDNLIKLIKKSNPKPATTNFSFRNQDRVILDRPQFTTDLFSRLKSHLPAKIANLKLIGINERLRMYRYQKGQRFSPHTDHWYQPHTDRITLHSILVYLNDDFVGGETKFTEQIEKTVVPKTGMVAIFQHKIRHEGCEVRRGIKYAIRTDTIYEKV